MNPLTIIEKYYPKDSDLYSIILTHSRCVARKALECIRNKAIRADEQFICEAAILHDIGIFRCDAPGIECFGTEPYIRHGIIGADILRAENLPRHALVCERHTGAGITCEEIIAQDLPLPHRDMLPLSIEEKAICYADKFYSKSRKLDEEKPLEKIRRQMYALGEDVGLRFDSLHNIFSA